MTSRATYASGTAAGLQTKISIGFYPDQWDAIVAYAKRHGCSFAEAVRTLVDKALQE